MTSIFKGKKVVVTGGAGFVGSYLVPLLLREGAKVLVVDDMRRGKYWGTNTELVNVDAGNVKALITPFKGAFAVFNLAAHVAGVIYNQSRHLEMYAENHRVQVAPVLAAELAGVERFLQVSSVCVYSPQHNAPAKEANGHADEPIAANNGYSWSKRMGEKAALWSTIPHVVIVRPSNLYGPHDYFDDRAHVIPALIRKALNDDVIKANGTGFEKREFLYVEDAAGGMLAALEQGADRRAYNLGTHGATCVSMRGLLAQIQTAAGTDKPAQFSSEHDAGDPARWSDCDLMANDTGWRWSTTLADGLQKTVDWYRGL